MPSPRIAYATSRLGGCSRPRAHADLDRLGDSIPVTHDPFQRIEKASHYGLVVGARVIHRFDESTHILGFSTQELLGLDVKGVDQLVDEDLARSCSIAGHDIDDAVYDLEHYQRRHSV